MSKSVEMKSKCACGGDINFKIKKPSNIQLTCAKASCQRCVSRYLFRAIRRHGKVALNVDFIHMSHELKEFMKTKKLKEIDEGVL